MTTQWDEWLASGPPHTLTQEQRNGEMAVCFEDAVLWDKSKFTDARSDALLQMAIRALKSERRQDAAGG